VQELMMLMSNLMQWKTRIPSFFRKAMRSMVEKQVHEIMTRNDWKDEAVRRSCISIRKYQATLSYSEAWMTEYAYTLVMLYKKEDRPKNAE
jgi:CRISPR/Cas system-associated protein Csx1